MSTPRFGLPAVISAARSQLHRSLQGVMTIAIVLIVFLSMTPAAWAFCGFFVSKADAPLSNIFF